MAIRERNIAPGTCQPCRDGIHAAHKPFFNGSHLANRTLVMVCTCDCEHTHAYGSFIGTHSHDEGNIKHSHLSKGW